MPSERLSKFLSNSGIAARRKCDIIIVAGRVKVNNITVIEPFYKVLPETDKVTVDNCIVKPLSKSIYLALYKPVNIISDLVSSKDRQNARSLISIKTYLFPVGRLDYNSEGLILFTNDGDFANKIMHPKYGIEKEYLVKFKGIISDDLLHKVQTGLLIEGSIYKIKSISFIKTSLHNSWYRIILDEGKNRMIRKIGSKIKHPVLKLKRIRIGTVRLDNLKPGEYRSLTNKEINYLLKLSESNNSKAINNV
jgi:23S rRNA pseudouridine2605 synthase